MPRLLRIGVREVVDGFALQLDYQDDATVVTDSLGLWVCH